MAEENLEIQKPIVDIGTEHCKCKNCQCNNTNYWVDEENKPYKFG